MAVDYFLIDGPSAVPVEFAAWQAAKKLHFDLFEKAIALKAADPRTAELNQAGEMAAAEAVRLERVAREAWLAKRGPAG